MKFDLTKASDWRGWQETREIETLEDLLALVAEFKVQLIIGQPLGAGENPRIMIYDDYVE